MEWVGLGWGVGQGWERQGEGTRNGVLSSVVTMTHCIRLPGQVVSMFVPGRDTEASEAAAASFLWHSGLVPYTRYNT